MSHHLADRRTPVTRVVKVLGTLLAATAAALVAAAVVVVAVLPRAVDGQAMTVLTGSMTPTIPVGSVALVRPVDPRTVQVGDVITYQVRPDEDVYVTHRVVEIRTEGDQTLYVLQGDANNVADDPILGDRIRGEVWFHVPWLGAVRDALHGRGGVYLVATLLLAWFAISQVGAGLRERREEKQARSAAPRDEVVLTRPVVLARFETGEDVAETDRAQLAALLGGHVVAHDTDSWTLLVVTTPTELDLLLDRLRAAGPATVQVAAAGDRLTLPGSTAADVRPTGVDVPA